MPLKLESAEEWGRRQAAKAPAWTDAKWRRICALLRISVADDSEEPTHKEVGADDRGRAA